MFSLEDTGGGFGGRCGGSGGSLAGISCFGQSSAFACLSLCAYGLKWMCEALVP